MKNNIIQKMGMREVLSQIRYAEFCYDNLLRNKNNNILITFSSIHSFLVYSAMISKILWSKKFKCRLSKKILAETLSVDSDLEIKKRNFRNTLEHYDERLVKWINKNNSNFLLDKNIGPKNLIKSTNIKYVRHYDPITGIFTLLDDDLDLNNLYNDIILIKEKVLAFINKDVDWDDLEDEEKQAIDEDRLLDDLASDLEDDQDDVLERLENLGYEEEDLIF